MQIGRHSVVTIDYTLTDPNGQTLDTSSGREPLAYLHGMGNIIPGLEQALEGRSTGDQLQVTIAPEQAYGVMNPELKQTIPAEQFRGVQKIEVGMQFRAQGPDGFRVVTVTDVSADQVTVDGNHPLAGVTLNFDVTIRSVRPATAEEVSHGHVHGPQGHHHH